MDPTLYEYPSPLEGWENQEPLSNELNPDGKSLLNPASQAPKSIAYTTFPAPITNSSRGAFDIHIYYLSSIGTELSFATALHQRIRYEFPELRIYPMRNEPIGPHPVGMFEVNLFTPAQFGAFVSWLVINRGPLSALIHPNSEEPGEQERDHTQRATWMGERFPLHTEVLRRLDRREKEGKNKGGSL